MEVLTHLEYMYYFSLHIMLIILMCFVYWLYVNVTLIVTCDV